MTSMSMRQMLEAGVHFGHQTRFWNPKILIFGERNRIHIINPEHCHTTEAAGFVRTRGRRRHALRGQSVRREARQEVIAAHALRATAGSAACSRTRDHPPSSAA
jgi:ribosomal protein S2